MRRSTVVLLALLALVVVAGAAVVGALSGVLPEWVTGLDVIEAGGTAGVLEGWVSKLDSERGVVHVSGGLFQLSVATVTVGPDADIRVEDKIGSIDDLREGVHLKICYDVRDRLRWARAIDVPPSAGSCRAVTTHTAEPTPAEEPNAAGIRPVAVSEPPAASPSATQVRSSVNEVKTQPAVSADVEPARSLPAAPRASAASMPKAPPQPAAVRRGVPAQERGAVAPAAPAPRETVVDGHDYGALVDWVLRR